LRSILIKKNMMSYQLTDQKFLPNGALKVVTNAQGGRFLEAVCPSAKKMAHGYEIPSESSYKLLEALASTNELCFRDKKLVCDFFGKNHFFWQIDDSLHFQGMVSTRQGDFALHEMDSFGFIRDGIWFIKGIVLRFAKVAFGWKEFDTIQNGPKKVSEPFLEELLENIGGEEKAVVFLGNSYEIATQQKEPLPILKLSDRKGAFANLWMDYSQEKEFPYHDSTIGKRMPKQEKLWEDDLLQTGYLYKPLGSSHYYCPTDKVSSSLAFLLELGWTIFDAYGKKLFLCSDKPDIFCKEEEEAIALRGTIRYGEQSIPIQDVVGAFNRKERFVSLGESAIGLVPDSWQDSGLEDILDDLELVSDGLVLTKTRAHLISNRELLKKEPSLRDLASKLSAQAYYDEALPSKSFSGKLRPYQQFGVNWLTFLYQNGFHGLLADDMGLGKTVQVLAFLSRLARDLPILIAAPTSLLFNWKLEVEKFLPEEKVTLHHGKNRSKTADNLKGVSIILTSFATLRQDIALLRKVSYQCLIVDEAQWMKNAESQLFHALCSLSSRFRLSITGTPIENSLQELWSHFHFLMPDLLGEGKQFAADSMAGISDARYLERIRKTIRPFILRRTKDVVAADLPEVIEQIVYIELNDDQRALYESFLAATRKNLISKVRSDGIAKHRMEIFEQLLRLRQICADPMLIASKIALEEIAPSSKKELLLAEIETLLSEGGKALIYSQFTSQLKILAKELTNRNIPFAYLDGSTADRSAAVKCFQEDPNIALFLISLKAGGTGLNLTAANTVFLLDPWWNDAVEAQAIARAHRIGSKHNVLAKKYIALETIEEKMVKIKTAKKELAKRLLDSSEDDAVITSALTEEDLEYLLS
jgi:superfamily II DNA or RNA helicase